MNTQQILKNTNIKFGTSGARGLVSDFSEKVCAAYTHAFISVMKAKFNFSEIAVGIDNRPSSVTMAQSIVSAIENLGCKAIYCGVLPTPALANFSLSKFIPCIMVTGSHIPFDRNGLKFYRPDGEITKEDESLIVQADVDFNLRSNNTELKVEKDAVELYIKRYTGLFKEPLLIGKSIGIYEHSSAGRDIYCKIFEALGASVTSFERSEEFVPIDTEAVTEEDAERAQVWSSNKGFDAIFSTDGDGDRPLISDEYGNWLKGDILGLISAITANIQALAVPVSCNTAIEKSNKFTEVSRTKIGSPYVIAEFDKLKSNFQTVAGFEANGGFILASDIQVNGKILPALPTRDAVLPAILLMIASKDGSISQCVSSLPKRFTASDRIKNFATERSNEILDEFLSKPEELVSLLGIKQNLKELDTTDGLRLILDNDNIIHLRPSGNAPELRWYVETSSKEDSEAILHQMMKKIKGI